MKYIKSTSAKAYTISGKTIPPNTSIKWLVLDNELYTQVTSNPVIKSLIKAEAVIVTDKEPTELASTPDALIGKTQKLTLLNGELEAEIVRLKAQIEAAVPTDVADVKAENEELKSSNEALKVQLAELDKTATEQIESLKAQVESLKAKKNSK